MNNQNKIYFRKRLMQELRELSGKDDCNFFGLNESDEVMPDLIDRASNFIDRSLSQNICDREKLIIRKIERALEDIANGDYGTSKLPDLEGGRG